MKTAVISHGTRSFIPVLLSGLIHPLGTSGFHSSSLLPSVSDIFLLDYKYIFPEGYPNKSDFSIGQKLLGKKKTKNFCYNDNLFNKGKFLRVF
ncbi:hypothetical protein UZ36_00975 [Candidatus Nitromaritima sp. SCGC AAA799-C22]|nr:hypothetical protein UZ36_00975 [Candidatus Nitromaritima sp. SCGC AAA799-C22]